MFESAAVERALGWRVFGIRSEEIESVLSETEKRSVMRLRTGGKIYFLKRIPTLSSQEAELIRSALENYMVAGQRKKQGTLESFDSFVRERNIALEKPQHEYLRGSLARITGSAGILSELLEHENIEEIAVIGLGKSRPVHVYDQAFGWLPTNLYFSREREVRNIVNAVAGKIGRRVTLRTPSINAFLDDGSRLNALMEPASVSGPAVTIRKFRKSPFTPSELCALGAASPSQMAFLWMAMQADCSMLVCGNTGSGKTTLLNSLFNFVPQNERIVVVEETPEISIPHRHTIRTTTAEGIEVGMGGLIVNTLRMRPDRVIVGEIRNAEEVKAFIDTLLSGQGKGSYGTFHAQSCDEAVCRLQNLGALWQDIAALDLLLVQKRWSSHEAGAYAERRALVEICEPQMRNGAVFAKKIFTYDFGARGARKFVSHGLGKKAAEKICRSFALSGRGMKKELLHRAKLIESLRGAGQEEFFDAICGYGKAP